MTKQQLEKAKKIEKELKFFETYIFIENVLVFESLNARQLQEMFPKTFAVMEQEVKEKIAELEKQMEAI